VIQTSKVEGAANQWRKVPTNCSKGLGETALSTSSGNLSILSTAIET
jgi:hypothetical protein